MPCERLLIRALDAERQRIETVAEVETGPAATLPEPTRGPPETSPPNFALLGQWCLSGQVLRGDAAVLRGRLPGLVPDHWEGPVLLGGLVGGLAGGHEPLGALVLGSGDGAAYASEHEPILAALCEPIAVALRNDRQLRELQSLREAAEADRRSLLARLGRQDIADTIVGEHSGLESVMRAVDLVARAEAPVLVLGETGTGKEVVARAIHARSTRSAGPFLRVNCGAIPPELADSELFGHERGSFTGAVARRQGWFERADGGTLFLDEIGELTPAVQVRLLRILQDGSFERVGGQQSTARQRAPDRGDPPGPGVHGGRRALSRRPLVPHPCLPNPAPAPAGAPGGHPGSRRPFRPARRPTSGSDAPGARCGVDRSAPGLRLAGQRAGAGGGDGAGGDPGGGAASGGGRGPGWRALDP